MEKWVDAAFERVCKKFARGAKQAAAQGIIPYMAQGDHYIGSPFDGNSWWTGGFWPGMMWQLYAATGEEVYKTEALRVEELLTRELRTFGYAQPRRGLHVCSPRARTTSSRATSRRRPIPCTPPRCWPAALTRRASSARGRRRSAPDTPSSTA